MENLKEYLKVDSTSKTGLRWIKSPSRRVKEGDEAFTGVNSAGYYGGMFNYKWYHAHQVIMYLTTGKLSDKNLHIDHVDGDKLNNSVNNLRFVNHAGNQLNSNRRLNSNNTSGIKGIDTYTKGKHSYWRAQTYDVNGKKIQKSSKYKNICIQWLEEQRKLNPNYIH